MDLSSFLSGAGEFKSDMATEDMNLEVNKKATSSTGASSLTTGSSSGASNLQYNMSMNTNSSNSSGAASVGLPTSPLSFSSSNANIPASSGLVGPSLAQQGGPTLARPGSQQDLVTLQQMQQTFPSSSNGLQALAMQSGTQLVPDQVKLNFRHHITQPYDAQNLSGTQQPGNNTGSHPLHVSTFTGMKQEQINEQSLTQLQPSIAGAKMKQEDLLHQQLMQNMLQRPDSLTSARFQRQESLQHQQSQHIQAQLGLLQQQQQQQQQQRLFQQQQILQSLPQHIHRSHLQQQQQQLQHHLQQQMASLTKQPATDFITCTRRLMQYMQNQRLRPPDNSISFWRKFVAEHFAPYAKMRWCVSLYGVGGRQSTGVFPQDRYHCDLCGCNPGRGFEATLEVLPRLFKMKYDNGELDELLFVDTPQELKLSSGSTVIKYEKAVQESIFEQLRVVRDGQLKIIFTADFKILSWDFCAKGHEELLPRKRVIHQVNQLALIASKCQNALLQNGASGVSSQELQSSCNLLVAGSRQLVRSWESPPINEIGFTKRFVRCLQISEVVNSMKDLIDFSQQNNFGPMESLAKFPKRVATTTLVENENQSLQPQDQAGFLVAEQSSKMRRLNDPCSTYTLSGNGSHSNSSQASPTSSLTSLQTSLTSLSRNSQQPPDTVAHQNNMCYSLQHPSVQSAQFNQQNTESASHKLMQELISPRSNGAGNFQYGQRVMGVKSLPVNGIDSFHGSGGVAMNNGDMRATGENVLNGANCLRIIGTNGSNLGGTIGSMNVLGKNLNLAALAQQQSLHIQDGASSNQHDFSNSLNGVGFAGEFGSFPLNWNS